MSDTNESKLIYEIMQAVGRFGAVFRTNAGSVKLPNGRTGIRSGKYPALKCGVGKGRYVIDIDMLESRIAELMNASIEPEPTARYGELRRVI